MSCCQYLHHFDEFGVLSIYDYRSSIIVTFQGVWGASIKRRKGIAFDYTVQFP